MWTAAEQLASPAVLAAAAVIVLTVVVWLAWRPSKLDLDKVPSPPGLPLIGSVLQLLRADFHRQVLEWADQYGPIYRVRALWWDALVVTDPTALYAICGRGEGALDKASVVYTPINQMCSPRGHPNLLTSAADPAWRAVRKAIAAAFAHGNIKRKFPVMRGVCVHLISKLQALSLEAHQQGQAPITVDVDACALRVTLDIIGLAGFGHDFKSVDAGSLVAAPPRNHLIRVLPRCFTEVMYRMLFPVRGVVPGMFKTGLKGETAFQDFQTEMRVLLHKCLLRPTPPAADDVSMSAQLWRVYNEQDPAPPDVSTLRKTQTQADSVDKTDESVSGLLPGTFTVLERTRRRVAEVLNAICTSAGGAAAALCSSARGRSGQRGEVLLSAERILSEISMLFIEGFETTGHTIAWTLLNVATIPGVQDRIAEELDSHGLLLKPCAAGHTYAAPPEPAPGLTVDQLGRLPYLIACVKESMRMLPVVASMGRQVGDRPTKVGPYLVPAHTPVAIPLYAIHNTTHNWERPQEFLPERWLQVPLESYVTGVVPLPSDPLPAASSKPARAAQAGDPAGPLSVASSIASSVDSGSESCASDHGSPSGRRASASDTLGQGVGVRKGTIAFMPFSEGPRNCVGQTMAKMEVMSFLVLLLGTFRLELAPEMGGREGVQARESTHLTLQTKGTAGIRMRLSPRWLQEASV